MVDGVDIPVEWRSLDVDVIGPLAEADPHGAAQYLLELAPKASAGQLAAQLRLLGGPALTKAEAKRWREAILARRRPGVLDAPAPVAADTVDVPTARDRFRTAIELGDAQGALRWGRVLETMAATSMPETESDDLDFGRLTDAMMSCYRALTDIARGSDLDAEAVWWRTLIARVPDPGVRPHPAHVALPAGSPMPAKLVPGG